jgi:hypothetical protein
MTWKVFFKPEVDQEVIGGLLFHEQAPVCESDDFMGEVLVSCRFL